MAIGNNAIYECETCGSSIELWNELSDRFGNVGRNDSLVRCADHAPSLPMRRVD